jgi:hypothetical protein
MKTVKVKILGVELEAPLLNPKVMRQYDAGIKAVGDKANASRKEETSADAIEMMCDAVIEFVDTIFGEGSAKKVFGDETDLLTCLDAFEELTELYEKQVNPVLQKYSKESTESDA